MEVALTPIEFLRRARKLYADREAVVDGPRRLTYAQFGDRIDRWSAALQAMGVGEGDRVAYISSNTCSHLEGYYAVPQIGGVIVPVNYRLTADDFAYRGVGTSSLTGQVINPSDRDGDRTPGGSSAGSAVAVYCGMAFAALGTDDGGSNRIPAVCSGVVGMKPTFGLVPRNGVIPTWPYLDTHGPLARTAADAALMLAAMLPLLLLAPMFRRRSHPFAR